MLNGAHAPNQTISPATESVLHAGGFESVKLLWIEGCWHSESDVAAVKRAVPYADIIYRGPDFPLPAPEEIGYPLEWARRFVELMYALRSYGATAVQFDNEPQEKWLSGAEMRGPWQYVFYSSIALEYIRANKPPDIELYSPPLSWSPKFWRRGWPNPSDSTLDEWLNAFKAQSYWRHFDKASANCYWQSWKQMEDPSFGKSFVRVHHESGGLPVSIAEYGLDPALNYQERPKALEAMRLMYPRYAGMLDTYHFVSEAYCYILPHSTPDWADREITDSIASEMYYPIWGEGRDGEAHREPNYPYPL